MPGVPVTCGDDTRVLPTHCTRGCGCNGHPAFPTPSDFPGWMVYARLGRIAPRDCGVVFATLHLHHPPPGRRGAPPDDRLQRVIQYSGAPVTESKSCGVRDTPLSRSMTALCGAAQARLCPPCELIRRKPLAEEFRAFQPISPGQFGRPG